MYDRMTEEANKENLNFNLDKIKKTPNTVFSHLLIKLAKQSNVHNEIKEKIYELTSSIFFELKKSSITHALILNFFPILIKISLSPISRPSIKYD